MDQTDRTEPETDEDDERRSKAEAKVLNTFGRARDRAFAALVSIGMEEGDTPDMAEDWANKCLRYASE